MDAKTMPAIEVFFSYAHEDETMRVQLEKHLTTMKRLGQITGWHDNKIIAGSEWDREINIHLNTAQIILLLISSDFIASDYCYSIQMKRALARHEAGDALVIPIILRPVQWEDTPFGKLKSLPTHGKPVTRWRSRDAAFADIAEGIRIAIKSLARTWSFDTSQKSLLKKTSFCANCKALVSLPMYCSRCGLPTMQICGECGEKNPLECETCLKCSVPLIQYVVIVVRRIAWKPMLAGTAVCFLNRSVMSVGKRIHQREKHVRNAVYH